MLPPPHKNGAALVTGASSGIGLALATALGKAGHNVILTARRTAELRALAEKLSADYSIRAEAVTCDLSDRSAPEQLSAAVDELGFDVDVLINNAGVGSTGPFQHADLAQQLAIVRVKVDAAVSLTGRFLPGMLRRRHGGILNVSSTTGFQPLANSATYAAANAFVLSFTEALHTDLAGSGVIATALCPGPVKTDLWNESGSSASTLASGLPSPLWMSPDDVAEAGIAGLRAGKRVVVPGVLNRLGALSGQHAPRGLLLRLAAAVAPGSDSPP
ncbi:SDR family NAD(P)-dependent oxidoreductase [Nocardia asteroides]|uniref:SDR family NAD(P)-dependent oxidoreductase n=1 Tax=Nocardia asteroides TaxID=1824 RepID=UPI001E462178|nr:SDR family oxidoreductase [Nocardia asteroides]UGT55164.1 SDR family oxidoreductase [Nocardia asteroides]